MCELYIVLWIVSFDIMKTEVFTWGNSVAQGLLGSFEESPDVQKCIKNVWQSVRGALDQKQGKKKENSKPKEHRDGIEREEKQAERNTNNSGWISPAIPESLSWLSCCLFPEACTWAKETHLDKERSNRDRGTQH